MKKLIVGIVAAALAGCASVAAKPPKKDAPPPRPIAAVAIVCGERTLQALYLVINDSAMVMFTKDDTVLMTIGPDGKEQDKSIGPSDIETVIPIAQTARLVDVVHVACSIATGDSK